MAQLLYSLPLTLLSSLPLCSFCSCPTPFFLCSHCRSALYCSRACQRAHYPFHRPHCTLLTILCAPASALFSAPSLPPSLATPHMQAAAGFLALCRAQPGDVNGVCASLWDLWGQGTIPDLLPAVLRLKAALAAARVLGGCDFSPALEASLLLACQLLVSGVPQLLGPGQALMLAWCAPRASCQQAPSLPS